MENKGEEMTKKMPSDLKELLWFLDRLDYTEMEHYVERWLDFRKTKEWFICYVNKKILETLAKQIPKKCECNSPKNFMLLQDTHSCFRWNMWDKFVIRCPDCKKETVLDVSEPL